jgi:P2 family phage contractile tail tube protein
MPSAGILGEFEEPVPGQFKSQQLQVGFRVIDPTMFQVAAATGTASLTFRGSQQVNDYNSGDIISQAVRIECRGGIKGIDLGKATVGKATDSKLSMEIRFIAVYIDDVEVLYLDKLNYIYRVNGVDLTAGTRANI